MLWPDGGGMDPRDERWALEYPGNVAELEASARRELASPPPAPPVGADPSNSVRVAVNADLQVEAIEVSRGWKDQLGSANFSTALFEAYTDGLAKALDHQAVTSLLGGAEHSGGEPLV